MASTITVDNSYINNGPVYTLGTNGAVGSSNVWTTTSSSQGSLHVEPAGKISLIGEKADIEINGVSLSNTLKVIQDRLNLLQPNPELEAEWDQLRELGEQYRKLEAEFQEKSKMWSTLKSMPEVEIK
jgi:hypothetical protein